ncbi:MAG: ribosomal protein S18-alanine N-acetyltransferase [Bariatricus sp.]
MVEEWNLKELSASDGEEIRQIAKLECTVFSDPWSSKEIENTLKQDHTFCVAAKCSEIVLGYFICYYVLDECEIARIAVAEEARCRGIGQILFEEMLAICCRKSLERILLDVRRSNHTAIRFYEKNGFQVDGIRKNYYGGTTPEDAILMSKDISVSNTQE